MRDLRIVFMGTPDFAVATLAALLKNNSNVVGVITAPDRPAGRGQKLNKSAVKQFAETHNLHILQPTNLKDENFISQLKALNANLQIVVAFRMLPEVVWKMPKYGTFNLHASLLPAYRGAAPINWAIINGEKVTGVTTFFIDEKIDTGEIILQERTPISNTDTVGSLHDKLMTLGSKLVLDTIQIIKQGNVATTLQAKSGELKTAYKLNAENTRIDWDKSAQDIFNKIRGLNPYPSAWTFLKNEEKEMRVKIFNTQLINTKEASEEICRWNTSNSPGAIMVFDKKIYISCTDGLLVVDEIQLPNKKRMNVKALLNGYNFDKKAKFF